MIVKHVTGFCSEMHACLTIPPVLGFSRLYMGRQTLRSDGGVNPVEHNLFPPIRLPRFTGAFLIGGSEKRSQIKKAATFILILAGVKTIFRGIDAC
jgi:hypothetical protein